jgi:uncharacterized protein (DUF305 family)
MRLKSIIIFSTFIITFTACATSQDAVVSTNQPTNNDVVITQNTRENTEDLEELFWARRDSTTMNFTQADVDFMSGMIGHHAQALIMSSLAEPNNASQSVQTLAARIINAQKDEIRIMQRWLSDRDQTVPQVKIEGLNLILTPGTEPSLIFSEEAVIAGLDRTEMAEDHSMHDMEKEKPEEMEDKMHAEMEAMVNRTSDMSHMANNGTGDEEMDHSNMDHSAMGHDMAMHDHSDMPGMLNDIQLQELADAKGKEFDKLFLRYMIQHHAGAITMVNELVSVDGAAQEVSIGKLAGDINVDQKTEIERMRLMLMEILESEGSE